MAAYKQIHKMLCLLALVLLGAWSATAQNTAPQATIREYGSMPAQPSIESTLRTSTNTPPRFCNPCLWYAGDFNWQNPKANALANEKDLLVSQSAVYVPFTVPKGKIWKITGAFGIVLAPVDVLDPAQADWSFSKGISTGNGGKLIKSGTSPATATLLGCNGGFAIDCLGILVKGIQVTLKAGRYWLTVVPYCTNSNDSNCQSARYFLADEEDIPPLNHYGPKDVLDASYITSSVFGFNFTPTWGSSGACGGSGCDMFSAGLLGTSKADALHSDR